MWQIAKEEEKGVYLNFLNFLINDSIYLLDESLNKILELKEIEAEMANTVEWERRPPQEREERLRVFHQWENVSPVYECLQSMSNWTLFYWLSDLPCIFHVPDCSIWHEAGQWGCWDACIHFRTNSSTFPSPWNGKTMKGYFLFPLICHHALCYF